MERPAAMTLRGNPFTLIGPELKVGDKAPEFEAIDSALKPVTLESTGHNVRVFSVVPSLDTPVCNLESKRFNEEAGKLPNVTVLVVSNDLPFAQKRWCGAENATNIQALSDHRTAKFGEAYGVLVQGGPLDRCLCRAIFVVGPDDTIKHVEYVKEITEHPNYEAALAAAKG